MLPRKVQTVVEWRVAVWVVRRMVQLEATVPRRFANYHQECAWRVQVPMRVVRSPCGKDRVAASPMYKQSRLVKVSREGMLS